MALVKTITIDGTTYAQQDSDGCSDACVGYKDDLCHVLGDCEVGRRVWVVTTIKPSNNAALTTQSAESVTEHA